MASDASNVTTGNAHEDMHTRFRNEFGIHFSESELQFALSFLDEVFEEGVKAERERINQEWLSLNLRNDNEKNWNTELAKFGVFMQNNK